MNYVVGASSVAFVLWILLCVWAVNLPDIDKNKIQDELCIKSHSLYSDVEECKSMPPEEFTKIYRLTNSLEGE